MCNCNNTGRPLGDFYFLNIIFKGGGGEETTLGARRTTATHALSRSPAPSLQLAACVCARARASERLRPALTFITWGAARFGQLGGRNRGEAKGSEGASERRHEEEKAVWKRAVLVRAESRTRGGVSE